MCETCSGTGSIHRRQTTSIKKVERFGYEFDRSINRSTDRLIVFDELVKSSIGGFDACHECAGKAEFEYQEFKRMAA